jgi:hypothetical protein
MEGRQEEVSLFGCSPRPEFGKTLAAPEMAVESFAFQR